MNEFFMIYKIKLNKLAMMTYISKRIRGKYGKCRGVTYVRNDETHKYSYDPSTATILVQDFNLKTPTGLTPESEADVLLPNNVQIPVTKEESMHPSYGTIALEEPTISCSKA